MPIEQSQIHFFLEWISLQISGAILLFFVCLLCFSLQYLFPFTNSTLFDPEQHKLMQKCWQCSGDRAEHLCNDCGWTKICFCTLTLDPLNQPIVDNIIKTQSLLCLFQDVPICSVYRDADGKLKIGGYFGAIFYELAQQLNFTPVFVEARENVTGSQVNGVWNGILGMLQRNEIDFAAGPMTYDINALPVASFVRPLLRTK